MKYNTRAWIRCRDLVRELDHYQCCQCGSNEGLEVHHILPADDFPKLRFKLHNLDLLCETCHKRRKTAEQILKVRLSTAIGQERDVIIQRYVDKEKNKRKFKRKNERAVEKDRRVGRAG